MHISRLVTQLKTRLKDESQTSVQAATGINQGQISRILRGEFTRISTNVVKLCKYAKIDLPEVPKSRLPPDLTLALNKLWSGSGSNAKALSRMLRAIQHYQATSAIGPDRSRKR